jgi:feruloyl esterase
VTVNAHGWAFNNRIAENDWGWRAVTETARVSKLLIKAFYSREQGKSYFAGCSTGGRMAAMEAQRFPNDFDGIISGAPALDYTGLVATSIAWNTQANTDRGGKTILNRAKVRMIGDAVRKACGKPTDSSRTRPRAVSHRSNCSARPRTRRTA